MLDILRKKASSLIVKVLLGGIAIVFIFFFGSTSLRNPEVQGEIAAKVDGKSITAREVEGRLRLNMEMNPYYKDLPETFQTQLRQAAVGELVQIAVIEGEVKKIGITVTDAELAQAIRKDPSLSKDGKFDHAFYQQKFRPGYANRYGIDYEEAIRRELLIDKLRNLFSGSIQVSDESLKNRYTLKNTRVSLKKVALSPDKSEKLWPLFREGKLTEAALKEAGAKEEEVPPTSLAESSELIPGASADAVKQIFALTEQNPFPPSPIPSGDVIFLVKLVKKETPDWEVFEKNKDGEREEMKTELAGEFFSNWYEQAASQSKIKVFE
ncbi:MAG: SurA N-terminal domain-containing protein [Deltaproteobacteria bacterium]|nr:SurA N-terminal domain-containing protein [Deltaproteobacteria bacterium]